MESEAIETLLYWFGAWAALCGGFWVIFERIEKVSAPELRKKAVSLFTLRYTEAITQWPDTFISGFDHIFGEGNFTGRRFYRSGIASILCVLILYLVWPKEDYSFFDLTTHGSVIRSLLSLLGQSGQSWALLVMLALYFNLIPDFVSLTETRYVLKLITRKTEYTAVRLSIAYISVFVIIDLILTLCIFVVIVFCGAVMAGTFDAITTGTNLIDTILSSLAAFGEILLEPFVSSYSHRFAPTEIYVYTTFFTSVWIWLYALSVIGVKIMLPVIDRFEKLKRLFDYKNKPFRTIGLFTNLIITVIFIAAGIVKIVRAIAS